MPYITPSQWIKLPLIRRSYRFIRQDTPDFHFMRGSYLHSHKGRKRRQHKLRYT